MRFSSSQNPTNRSKTYSVILLGGVEGKKPRIADMTDCTERLLKARGIGTTRVDDNNAPLTLQDINDKFLAHFSKSKPDEPTLLMIMGHGGAEPEGREHYVGLGEPVSTASTLRLYTAASENRPGYSDSIRSGDSQGPTTASLDAESLQDTADTKTSVRADVCLNTCDAGEAVEFGLGGLLPQGSKLFAPVKGKAPDQQFANLLVWLEKPAEETGHPFRMAEDYQEDFSVDWLSMLYFVQGISSADHYNPSTAVSLGSGISEIHKPHLDLDARMGQGFTKEEKAGISAFFLDAVGFPETEHILKNISDVTTLDDDEIGAALAFCSRYPLTDERSTARQVVYSGTSVGVESLIGDDLRQQKLARQLAAELGMSLVSDS